MKITNHHVGGFLYELRGKVNAKTDECLPCAFGEEPNLVLNLMMAIVGPIKGKIKIVASKTDETH